jgi:hypothetical protein
MNVSSHRLLTFAPHKKPSMSEEKSLNFIEEIVEEDLKAGKHQQIVTRFPPNRMVTSISAMPKASA